MILEFLGVNKHFPNTNFSLNNINLAVEEGEVVGLVGQNGSGKSTILKMAAALVKADSGKINYLSKELQTMTLKELRSIRKSISYIFQDSNLLDNKTVKYHLSLVFKLAKLPCDNKAIDEILEFMDIAKYKNSFCGDLSGGQKQKIAISMALLQKPKVLLCDEISSALDKNSEEEIFNLLLKIKRSSKVSMLVVSHNLKLIKNICDKVYFLEENTIAGSLVPQKGELADSLADYRQYVEHYLLR